MAILHRVLLISCLAILSIFWFDAPVLAASSQNTLDIFNQGVNNIRQQNYQQAKLDLTQVIKRQDNLVGAAYSNRCLANLQLQNYTAAEADCIRAIKNNSENIEAYLNLGLAYYRQGEYELAIAEYQQAIQRDKGGYRAYYNRGLAYLASNKYHQAIADYQTALMHSSNSNTETKSLIHNDLALAYLMLTEDEAAIFNLERAIALNDNNYHAYYNRGCTYHRQGKYQAAIQDFSQVVQLQPDFTQAYVHLGILHNQIGARDTAFNDLNLALEQYQNQGNDEQYDLVFHLKQQLFYAQLSQIA